MRYRKEQPLESGGGIARTVSMLHKPEVSDSHHDNLQWQCIRVFDPRDALRHIILLADRYVCRSKQIELAYEKL